MYRFQVIKQVHSCFASVSTKDVYLYRDVELPFPPYPSLTLLVAEDTFELKEVYFDVERQEFKVYTEADKELYTLSPAPDARGIEEIVEDYTEAGWVIRK